MGGRPSRCRDARAEARAAGIGTRRRGDRRRRRRRRPRRAIRPRDRRGRPCLPSGVAPGCVARAGEGARASSHDVGGASAGSSDRASHRPGAHDRRRDDSHHAPALRTAIPRRRARRRRRAPVHVRPRPAREAPACLDARTRRRARGSRRRRRRRPVGSGPVARRRGDRPRARGVRASDRGGGRQHRDAVGDHGPADGPRHPRAGVAVHDLLPGGAAARRQHPTRLIRHRRDDPSCRRDVLDERGARGAHDREGLRGSAADLRERVLRLRRGRHQPGRDDALQRRLLRRARARGAPAPLALHRPLPAGPRSHDLLGRPGAHLPQRLARRRPDQARRDRARRSPLASSRRRSDGGWRRGRARRTATAEAASPSEYTRRVYEGERLRRNERYVVRYGTAPTHGR